MRTTLQPPGPAAPRGLPAPLNALMQAYAPLIDYLAQRLACWLPSAGMSPSNRDLAGRQSVDGSPPHGEEQHRATERRRRAVPPWEDGSLAPTARTHGCPTRGRYRTAWEGTPSCPALGMGPALTTEGETYGPDGRD
jgi:hypothetical protein